MAWPITISTLSYSVMTLTDTLLVGHLGAGQIAGVGLAGTTAFLLICFSFGLMRGAKTLVSQAMGARRLDEADAYLGAAIVTAIGLGAVTMVTGQLVAELLRHVAATAASGEAAHAYLRVRVLGAPIILTYVALREVSYGKGKTRAPMVATVLANVVNIVLAYTFIYVLRLGVAGAAWATVCAHGVECGTLIVLQSKVGWRVRGLRKRHLVALWRVGAPTGIQFMLELGSFTALAMMLAAMSETQMAAHQIALQVIHFSFLPASAIGEAAAVMAGQAVGANRDDLLVRVSRRATLVAVAYTAMWSVVLALGAPYIVAGFGAKAALSGVAVRLLYVAAVFQVFDGVNIIARGVLRGAGDVRMPAVLGVLTAWACTPPLTWLLGYQLGLGALGGWLGLCCEIVVGAFILWRRVETGGWKRAAADSRAKLAAAYAPADLEGELELVQA